MFPTITGSTNMRLLSASLGRGLTPRAAIRTAYKDEFPLTGAGEIDALIIKDSKAENLVLNFRNVPRPYGVTAFEKDYFRKSARIWELPEKSSIPSGLVAFNIEPGVWLLCPNSDISLKKYSQTVESMSWKRIEPLRNKESSEIAVENQNVPDFTKSIDRNGLALVDSLILSSIENYIVHVSRNIGYSKYDDEIAHIDNDINRSRNYLTLYRTNITSAIDPFLTAGSFTRAKSNQQTVLRPKSELFRSIINWQIDALKKLEFKCDKADNKQRANLCKSQATMLKEFLGEHFGESVKGTVDVKSVPSPSGSSPPPM